MKRKHNQIERSNTTYKCGIQEGGEIYDYIKKKKGNNLVEIAIFFRL